MNERAALSAREIDLLQEMATIGCGAAATAIGRLLRRRVELDVPEAWVGRAPGAVADFLGALGSDLVAVGVRLEGALSGHLVLALPERDAERLAAALGHAPGPAGWTALGESAVAETGNIVGSAFVSAVARLLGGARLLLSTPLLARGRGRACLDRLVPREAGRVAVATRFTADGPGGIEGLILVLPELARLPRLLDAIGA